MVFNVGKKACCMNKSTVMRLFIFLHSVHQNLLRRPRSNIQIWRTFSYSRIVLIKQGKPITEVQTLIKIY